MNAGILLSSFIVHPFVTEFPSQSGASSNSSSPSLEVGLAALKRKDFREAIAHLAPLARQSSDKASQTKACMGLVMAYEQSGKAEKAIALCQRLRNGSNRQMRQWATHTLNDITRRHPHIAVPALTAETNQTKRVEPPQSLGNTAPATVSEPGLGEATAIAGQENARTVQPLWRQAERAQRWAPLKPLDRAYLWGLAGLSVVLLALILRVILLVGRDIFNGTLLRLGFLTDLRGFYIYSDPLAFVLLFILVSFAALPWLMPLILRRFYGMQPFSVSALEQHSPEASKLLRQFFKQHDCPVPDLGLLPLPVPIIFTCGVLPQKALIVMSQGLLQQLEADEIAAVTAAEIGHIEHLDFMVLSLVVLVAQLPYLGYTQLAAWGDALRSSPSAKKRQDKASQTLAVVLSSLCYGIYRLCRLAGLWVSRLRVYYSDRTTVNLTGNPNGMTRALMKMTLGIAHDLQARQQTDRLLESFDLLLPVGPRTALTLGSIYSQNPDVSLFQWDLQYPYRRWLALNNTHPLMGDRLSRLSSYARQWQLEPELDLQAAESNGPKLRGRRRIPRSSLGNVQPSYAPKPLLLLLQAAPYLGVLMGWVVATLLQQIGAIAFQLQWFELDWMNQDTSLLWGLPLIGFGIGMLLRINRLFPDFKSSTTQVEPDLMHLLVDSKRLPVEGQPVRLQGKLLGRRGIGNQLSQDLILRCEGGCIRLHYAPRLGPLASVIAEIPQPAQLLQRNVVVKGWFRRGATPWIDIDTIQPQQGKGAIAGGLPIWSTSTAVLSVLWGAYSILTGGL